MFDFLFAIEHLPAMNAKHFSIWFRSYYAEFMNKCIPFWGIPFYHLIYVFVSRSCLPLNLIVFLLTFRYKFLFFLIIYLCLQITYINKLMIFL